MTHAPTIMGMAALLLTVVAVPSTCGNDVQIIEWEYVEANEGCVDAETSIEWVDGRPMIKCYWDCALDPKSAAPQTPARVTYWISNDGFERRHWKRGCGSQS